MRADALVAPELEEDPHGMLRDAGKTEAWSTATVSSREGVGAQTEVGTPASFVGWRLHFTQKGRKSL